MNIDSNYQFHKHKKKKKSWTALLVLIFGLGTALSFVLAYPKVFASSAALKSGKALALHDPLLITFSDAMIPETFEGKLKIYPETEIDLRWQNQNRELVVSPAKGWKPQTQYQISIDGARNIMLVKRYFSFSFNTVDYPSISSFFPEAGSQKVVLDIEDPIALNFGDPINDFKVKINIDPPAELESRIDLEKNRIALIPKTELEKGKKYALQVFIKGNAESDDAYRNILDFDFTTKPEAPLSWEKDFFMRLEQAKLFTAPQVKEGKYIDINLKSQVMTIFENGQLLDAYMISSGKRGLETPQGTFHIANKFPRAWSKAYGLFMPFWMALVPSGQFGIHELPEWPGGYKEGANHLGTPVSHGCVRLGVGPAERVYNWAEVGTPVVVHI